MFYRLAPGQPDLSSPSEKLPQVILDYVMCTIKTSHHKEEGILVMLFLQMDSTANTERS